MHILIGGWSKMFSAQVVDDSMNIASSRHNRTAAQNSQDELTETAMMCPKPVKIEASKPRKSLH